MLLRCSTHDARYAESITIIFTTYPAPNASSPTKEQKKSMSHANSQYSRCVRALRLVRMIEDAEIRLGYIEDDCREVGNLVDLHSLLCNSSARASRGSGETT